MQIMSVFQIRWGHFSQSEQINTSLQSLQITRRKRERQKREGCCYYTALSEFFTHTGVQCKLRVAGAGESTKQALVCERWIRSGSQRVCLCYWTKTRDTFYIGDKLKERSERSWVTSISQLFFFFSQILWIFLWDPFHMCKQIHSSQVLPKSS